MTKTTINNIINFLLQHKRKNRIILFIVVTAILFSYGIMNDSVPLLKGFYPNWIIPATIFILSINIIIAKIEKKTHRGAKIIKCLLYISKYSCILFILCLWFIISAFLIFFVPITLVIKEIIILLLPILSLLLLL